MRAFMLTEPEEDELDYPGESETVEEQTTSVTSNRSRVSEPYKYDLQERLKETLERMRSTSFDNVSARATFCVLEYPQTSPR
ncbi:hypothetical protein Y032_0038g3538 [Ancylostoma ceylanicum]|nr:hypothetical protein Y032_0038g3538 [Ancylostoma ceylanicum]